MYNICINIIYIIFYNHICINVSTYIYLYTHSYNHIVVSYFGEYPYYAQMNL